MENSKLLSRLTKSELVKLPGFKKWGDSDMTVKRLRLELNSFIYEVSGKSPYAWRVSDYKKLYKSIPKAPKAPKFVNKPVRYVDTPEYQARMQKKKDDELFTKVIPSFKSKVEQEKNEKRFYKSSLKENARKERIRTDLMIRDELELMELSRTEADELSKQYRERIKKVKNHDKFQKRLTKWMKLAKDRVGFEVVVGDNEEKKLAFCEVLRYLYAHKRSNKDVVLVKAWALGKDVPKWSTLHSPIAESSKSKGIDILIGHISGEIDLQTDCSDTHPYIADSFIPVKYELVFLNADDVKNNKNRKGKRYWTKKYDEKIDGVTVIELEVDDEFRELMEGSFFRYTNETNIDLSRYQIYSVIDSKNYRDNCFVYACNQSDVFTESEMDSLRRMVLTRSVPNNKIYDIAREFECHFTIKRIEDNTSKMIINVDTRDMMWSAGYNRSVEMLLYKEHYMINDKDIGCTTYYISHQEELDREFAHISLEKRRLIRKRNNKGSPQYAKKGASLSLALKYMFDNHLFREINSCEQNILSTCEYDSHLNEYIDLDYDEKSCCRLINRELKKPKYFSKIYYSDFETDVTVTPHKEYLNCTVWWENGKLNQAIFEGDEISKNLLDFLESGSLTYFHNLKYDACFFKNVEGWESPSIIERCGTVLQIQMCKVITPVDGKKFVKRLTFADSYSLIPAPLRDFSTMFNLNCHKEVMAYELYTEENRSRKVIPIKEFMDAYDKENWNKKSLEELERDHEQLIENSKKANAYGVDSLTNEQTIDIMKYAIYYCLKDCEVLMKGVTKFNKDLLNVFKEVNVNMHSIHNYISVSAIGYQFCKQYGCFDECYELSGKPQDFLGRCVSGGRTMTAGNRKNRPEGRLQDFDAVSLYPSAMKFMSGVPKGKPKVIPANPSTEQLLGYDTFFAEINIKSLHCKSTKPYEFGLVFKYSENGSKLYGNEPVDGFYLDKRYFMDLMEYYDMEYEFVRGYYFNEGFNDKINDFIQILFNLRLRYKQEKNPLQNTIKLLLNSIYGKSILKPIKTEIKCVPKSKMFSYIQRNYNYICEVNENNHCPNVYVKRVKPIAKHFNLPQFGVSVLSWSKYLMNRVMCTAEQNSIPIFYQDTDSMHLNESDVPKLAEIFENKYGSKLIGSGLGQFHCDFDAFEGAVGEIHSRKLIALGKKSYLDILVDEAGNEGLHIRLKGIPKQVILNKCKRLGIDVIELYGQLYEGESIEFDLLDGCKCFRKNKFFEMTNPPKFPRSLKFK